MTSECFYCGVMYCHSAKTTGDHMPIPERNEGTDIVPCCTACHDMKDRIPLHQWHSMAWKEIQQQWPLFGRYTRIYLAKSLSVMSDYNEQCKDVRQKAKVKQ